MFSRVTVLSLFVVAKVFGAGSLSGNFGNDGEFASRYMCDLTEMHHTFESC